MSPGVQARFMLHDNYELVRTQNWELVKQPSMPAVDIKGYDARLELYGNDWLGENNHKAIRSCVRLYIEKAFTNWLNVFKDSWVGFYKDEDQDTSAYTDYHYVSKFSKESRSDIQDYDVYVYQSDMRLSPGVQARFILNSNYRELVRTQP
ncbi:hypothetical protein DPEC_G00230050 [Dallia pectoralis]|uniref:Uncharacterized protein n=1 Tax=Dallia pectoralis TaxID=75939 RepID=A0ACC2G1D7_DALPE|nr:hypothetical protein DPEC_G00230050 [Dallia pectoralis]